jgi:hypothetical protein
VFGAIRSELDFSVLHALRAERRAAERRATAKLRVLRELRRHRVLGLLSKHSETRIEQSWNENLFAQVFGYRTMFSGGGTPFHLLPKNPTSGTRIDDFSLGEFGVGESVVRASAELKSPGTDLLKAQGANYDNLSPVEQGFRAAREHPETCRHVLVSNFEELRLYRIEDERTPLAIARLAEVQDENDLAILCAHFDRQALIGDARRKADLLMPDDPNHPRSPLASAANMYRIVARFTPDTARDRPLYEVEAALRRGVKQAPFGALFFTRPAEPPMRLRIRYGDGWACADGENTPNRVKVRIATSLLGQVQGTFHITWQPADGVQKPVLVDTVLQALRFFLGLIDGVHATNPREGEPAEIEGVVAVELRDVRGAQTAAGALAADPATANGTSNSSEFITSDLSWTVQDRSDEMAARALAELAIYFRGDEGGVAVDLARAAAFLVERAPHNPPLEA